MLRVFLCLSLLLAASQVTAQTPAPTPAKAISISIFPTNEDAALAAAKAALAAAKAALAAAVEAAKNAEPVVPTPTPQPAHTAAPEKKNKGMKGLGKGKLKAIPMTLTPQQQAVLAAKQAEQAAEQQFLGALATNIQSAFANNAFPDVLPVVSGVVSSDPAEKTTAKGLHLMVVQQVVAAANAKQQQSVAKPWVLSTVNDYVQQFPSAAPIISAPDVVTPPPVVQPPTPVSAKAMLAESWSAAIEPNANYGEQLATAALQLPNITNADLIPIDAAIVGAYRVNRATMASINRQVDYTDPMTIGLTPATKYIQGYKAYLRQTTGRATPGDMRAMVNKLISNIGDWNPSGGTAAGPVQGKLKASGSGTASFASLLPPNSYSALMVSGSYVAAGKEAFQRASKEKNNDIYANDINQVRAAIIANDLYYNGRALQFVQWINGTTNINPVPEITGSAVAAELGRNRGVKVFVKP